jgi:predicted nucleotidyltransferase component of viral defense system
VESGTSLSKVFGAIARFSEDVDFTWRSPYISFKSTRCAPASAASRRADAVKPARENT